MIWRVSSRPSTGFAVEGGVGEGDVHEDEIDMGAGDVEDGVAVFLEDAVDAAGEFEMFGEDEFISGIIFDGEYAIALHCLCSFGRTSSTDALLLDSNADRRREVSQFLKSVYILFQLDG